MAAIVGFSHLINGFDNKALTELMGAARPPYTSRHATYDLRRLRRKRLIERLQAHPPLPAHPAGQAVAVLFTKAYGRVLGTGHDHARPEAGTRDTQPKSPRRRVEPLRPHARQVHHRRAGRSMRTHLIWL